MPGILFRGVRQRTNAGPAAAADPRHQKHVYSGFR